jgi:hypothetical protein
MDKITEINEKLCHIYLSSPIEAVSFLYNEKNIEFINLNYKEGRIFEFCCLNKSKNYMEHILALVDWSKKFGQENLISKKNKSNSLISAVTSNRLPLIKYLLTSNEIIEHADISYANYGAFFNCLKDTVEKRKILDYFIDDYGIEKTLELEKLLKKNNSIDLVARLNARDLFISLNQTINFHSEKKKIKI